MLHHKKKKAETASPKNTWKKNRYFMLSNIWKTCWLSAQILPHGCWAWERNRVAVRLTVRSLSEANTLFIRLSVCLFIWLSNYPSQQTAHHELNVNNIVDVGHVRRLLGLLSGQLSQATLKGNTLGYSWSGERVFWAMFGTFIFLFFKCCWWCVAWIAHSLRCRCTAWSIYVFKITIL